MTLGISRRVQLLERAGGPQISPAAKAWLGHALTEREWEEAAKLPRDDRPLSYAALRDQGLSDEAARWLADPETE